MDGIDLGVLVIRAVVGLLLVAHGVGNLFGWLGGFGLDGTGEIFERLGFRPGRLYAGIAGITEVVAGTLLAIGLATPLAAAAIVGVMLNTIFTAHRGKGPWYFNGGWEYNLTLLTVATALAFTGPGAASIDSAFGVDLGGITSGAAALAVGLGAGAAVLALRRTGTSEARAPDGADVA
jgi:putative oxidoreductase